MLSSNFLKFGQREIGEIVRRLPDKKICRYWADCAQNLPGPAPKMYSMCSRFHPHRFTFGGVIAERLNTVETCYKVNQNIRLKPNFEPNNNSRFTLNE